MAPPFFWFPLNTQEWPGRWRSLFVTIICILGVIFKDEPGTKWLWVGFTCDFVIAATTGGTGAPLTAIGQLFSIPLERRYEPGTPRQTALFVNLCFALAGTFCLFFPDEYSVGTYVILLMHAGASLLAAGNFCMVCFMYHMSMKFIGFPPKDTVEVCNDAVTDVDAENTENDKRVNPPTPERGVYKTPTGGFSVEYTKKGDDYEREDFHPIKRTVPTYFISALSLSGFALLWKQIQMQHWMFHSWGITPFPNIQKGWVDAFIIVAVVWSLILLLLYLAKIALYPHRFLKDCQKIHNFLLLSGMSCSWLLIADVLSFYEDFEDLAIAIWWMAMPVQLFISVFGFGRFASQPMGMEAALPVYLLPSFGLLLLSVVSTDILYKQEETISNYGDLGRAFLGAGIGFAVVFPICLFRMMFFFTDFRMRPSISFFSAILSLISIGMLREEQTNVAFWFRIFLWASVIFFFFVVGAGMNMYFMEGKFDMNYWSFVFPTILLAMASNYYYLVQQTHGAKWLSLGFTSAACWGVGCAIINTLIMIGHKKLWVPFKKVGPLTINKSFHYYFRGVIPKLNKWSERVDVSNESSVNTFIDNLELFLIVFREHAEYEEKVLFPVFRAYFPDVTQAADEEHQRDAGTIVKMMDGIQTIRSSSEASERSAAIQMLQGEMQDVGKDLIAHIDWEEDNLNWIVRKFMNVGQQKDLLIDIFKSIPILTWRKMLPHMMQFIPIPSRREKLIRCLLWAMPYHAQMISVWMEDHLPPFFMTRTVKNIPEITPRSHWNYNPFI